MVKGRGVSVFSASVWRKLPEASLSSKDVLGAEKHLLIFIKLFSCYSRRECWEGCTICYECFRLEHRVGFLNFFQRQKDGKICGMSIR